MFVIQFTDHTTLETNPYEVVPTTEHLMSGLQVAIERNLRAAIMYAKDCMEGEESGVPFLHVRVAINCIRTVTIHDVQNTKLFTFKVFQVG
jgi:hypothetical protein